LGGLPEQIPLRARRQRDAKGQLQALDSRQGHPVAIAQDRQHRRDLLAVFGGASLRRSPRRENSPAKVATQPHQFVEGRPKDRLGDHADEEGRLARVVKPASRPERTGITSLKALVRHGDALGPGVILSAIASMALSLVRRRVGAGRVAGRTIGGCGLLLLLCLLLFLVLWEEIRAT